MNATVLEPIVRRALAEDLLSGDLTSEACIAQDHASKAFAVAREDLVASGAAAVREDPRRGSRTVPRPSTS